MFDYVVLGMVLHEELTGYDIKKEFEQGVGNFYKVSYGSLYPALKRLTEKGYLIMKENKEGNRQKKYYKATNLGKEVFLEWLSQSFDPKETGVIILIKIYFFGELPKEVREERFKEFEIYSQKTLRELQAIEKSVSGLELEDRDYYQLSTLYYGLENLLSTMKWFDHIRKQKPFSEYLKNKKEKSNE